MADNKKDSKTKAKKATSKKIEGVEAATASPKAKKISTGGSKRAPFIQKTYFAKNHEVPDQWRLIDADGQTLGRLSSFIVQTLMGKLKPTFTPHSDAGDHVVVINAEKIALTGKKWTDKVYQHHTNYAGGLKTFTAKQILETRPERLIKLAVYRMLPKSRGHMARHWFAKLMVYAGTEHPHKAQNPQPVKLPNLGANR